jgi:hypothetical protein
MGRRGMHIEILVGKPEGKRPIGRPRHSGRKIIIIIVIIKTASVV